MADVTTVYEETAAIFERLRNNWDVDTVPIAWPGSEFTPASEAEWLEIRVARQQAFNADIVPVATRTVRYPGLVSIWANVPQNTGSGRALLIADEVAAVFRNVTVEGAVFRAPGIFDLGVDGGWYRVRVDCPYWRDTIHT